MPRPISENGGSQNDFSLKKSQTPSLAQWGHTLSPVDLVLFLGNLFNLPSRYIVLLLARSELFNFRSCRRRRLLLGQIIIYWLRVVVWCVGVGRDGSSRPSRLKYIDRVSPIESELCHSTSIYKIYKARWCLIVDCNRASLVEISNFEICIYQINF